ncbi:E3 ubiquitin-protein ligase parkin-like [Cottoperca gobio]|uniref:E3 ubiquitin-protein ligase parkin n=1 Tax=Cottoperca gobio TaxID=56716 RepID=A0A6J2PAC7_COTGO|nr:E3 ubiquitin-protein ligase parkin-like [Cottoperca gobio]
MDGFTGSLGESQPPLAPLTPPGHCSCSGGTVRAARASGGFTRVTAVFIKRTLHRPSGGYRAPKQTALPEDTDLPLSLFHTCSVSRKCAGFLGYAAWNISCNICGSGAKHIQEIWTNNHDSMSAASVSDVNDRLSALELRVQQQEDELTVMKAALADVLRRLAASEVSAASSKNNFGIRNTTLLLSQGPSSWDDVLLRGRIHGVCQSDSCHSNDAEFYMKCASHPTSDDDPSVALDLIMTNSRDVPCIACSNIMPVVLVFQCSERHVICLDCFLRYCETRLSERQFVNHAEVGYSLPCAAGCVTLSLKSCIHFRILGEDQYGRYLQYAAEQCLLMIGGLMCPSAGCGAGLVPPEGSRWVQCDRRLGCGFIFCRSCREEYHEGACPSQQVPPTAAALQGFVVEERASLRGRWDQASLLLLQESTKRCPKCSVPVEKNGGCMHMHCPLCGADWCWLCGVTWNTDCMGNHWFG